LKPACVFPIEVQLQLHESYTLSEYHDDHNEADIKSSAGTVSSANIPTSHTNQEQQVTHGDDEDLISI
jgi:hypothetical protein